MQHTNASKTVRYPSLIETLSQGFKAVNRCLWVLAIPVLLDVLYWLGPRMSLQPLYDRSVRLAQTLDPQGWAELQQQLGSATTLPAASIDLTPFGNLSAAGLPKFLNILGPMITLPPPPWTPATWQIGNFGALLGMVVLINLVGLVAFVAYLVPIAHQVQGSTAPQLGVRRWGRVAGSFAGILLTFFCIGLLVIVPGGMALVLSSLFGGVGGAVSVLGVSFAVALLMWLFFTASFSFDAVLLSGVGPIRALLTSLFIVQRSFWSACGLFALGWMILLGLSVVWQIMAATTVGLVVAMLGSAYISSGLAAAHLIFYRDRLSRVARPASISQS